MTIPLLCKLPSERGEWQTDEVDEHKWILYSVKHCLNCSKSARENFVFDSDRLIRLVIEDALNHLPSTAKTVFTPPGGKYAGLCFPKSNCGISIVRSGEAMEKGLRDCCRSIRIGKILIEKSEDDPLACARVLYAKLPADISLRKVLLLYPIMHTGATVIEAIQLLLEKDTKEENIILINLFATPAGDFKLNLCTLLHWHLLFI